MSKNDLLDRIRVETPCEQDWKTMRGNDQFRFCDHCAKDVHNISAMTRKRARKLVAESNGNLCVRYTRLPNGKIQTIKNTLHQITRHTGIAAGVLGTSLTVSTLAYAQETPVDNNQNEPIQIVQIADDKSDNPNGAISGTITDPNGAFIPFAFVTIANEQTNFYQSVNANQEGFYEFKDVPRGVYKLKFDAGGFASREFTQIAVNGGSEATQNAQLSLPAVAEVVTVGGELPEGTSFTMGVVMLMPTRTNRMVMAVEKGDLEEVKVRVAMGERVNVKDKNYGGNSPLHVAVEYGNLEMVQFLLGAGAKINSKNSEKQTPLMMLDGDATPELVTLLISHGAKINLVDKQGDTALMRAAEAAEPEVLQALMAAGANVNAVNKKGRTALMAAADEGNLENVKLLLGAGANAQMVDKKGETALSATGNEDVKQLLIAYGAFR